MPMDIKPKAGTAGAQDKPNTSMGVMDETAGTADIAKLLATIEQLQARLDAAEGRTVERPAFDGEVPRYRILTDFFGPNDHLYGEGDEIDYLGEPNTEMLPINEAAQKRMQAYVDYLNQCAMDKARIYGRAATPVFDHNGRIDTASLVADNMRDEKVAMRTGGQIVPLISMPQAREAVPQMPHTPEAQARARMAGTQHLRGELIVSATQAPKAPQPGPAPAIQGRSYRGSNVA